VSKRDDLGRGVLEDLAALRAKGSISSILPARRVDPVPNTLAQEMSAGYIQTIARLKSERESGKVVLELDPKQVRASELANRHALSLKDEDEDLNRLKADIARQGQLEPIRVRPAAEGGGAYEIVYGHRRHAACLALDAERPDGWKVLALLDAGAGEIRTHVLKMYQENAARKDLSAYEQGHMFRLWLTQRIFDSQSAIAEEIKVSRQLVSKYLKCRARSALRPLSPIRFRSGATRSTSSRAKAGASRFASVTPCPRASHARPSSRCSRTCDCG